jgi:hypothetical protein
LISLKRERRKEKGEREAAEKRGKKKRERNEVQKGREINYIYLINR